MLDALPVTPLVDVEIGSIATPLLPQDQEQTASCCASIVKAMVCLIKGPENIVEGLLERVANLAQKINLGERAARIAILSTAIIIIGEFTGCLIEQYYLNFDNYEIGMVLTTCPGRLTSTITAFFATMMFFPGIRPFTCGAMEGSMLAYALQRMPRMFLRTNLISTIVMSAGILPLIIPDPYGLSDMRVARYLSIAAASILLGGGMSKFTQYHRNQIS